MSSPSRSGSSVLVFVALGVICALYAWYDLACYPDEDREFDAGSERQSGVLARPALSVQPDAGTSAVGAAGDSTRRSSRPELPNPPTASERLAGEETEHAWAEPQERAIKSRLAALDNPFLDLLGVECRSSCCRVALSFEWVSADSEASRLAYNAVLLDLQSAVGFGGWAQSMQIDSGTTRETSLTACFDRSVDTLATPVPDRLAERSALLEESRPALRACIEPGTVRFLSLLAIVEADGVVRVKRHNSSSLTEAAVACIDKVVESWTVAATGQSEFLSVAVQLSRQ